MANYHDGMEGGKHNSENVEASIAPKSFTVSITFECVDATTPLEASKIVAKWLVENEDAYNMIYDVEDETTGQKYIVDLDADDEDAVLPA